MLRFFLLFVLLATSASAHAIDHRVDTMSATVLTINYVDGSPVAFESYEIRSPGNDKPFQVGRTDRLGRVALLPDSPGEWSVKVFTDDGHGLTTTMNITEGLSAAVENGNGFNRLTGLLGGLLLIAVLYMTLQTINRRKST